MVQLERLHRRKNMLYTNPTIELPQAEEAKSLKKATLKIGKEYIKLDPTYFVFIDVLGFKETFHKDMSTNIKDVFEYFNSLMEQMRCLNQEPDKCYAGQTSDSLYFYTTELNYLIWFINVFLHFNLYAMSKGVFFRGGIAKGTLYVNKPYQFYGDCVINSFLLEEQIAQYPRIAIDKATMKDLGKKNTLWKFEEVKSERNFLIPFSEVIEEDISVYLGTPNAIFQKNDENVIKKVRKIIAENQAKSEFNDKLYQKYSYLLKECDELILRLRNR